MARQSPRRTFYYERDRDEDLPTTAVASGGALRRFQPSSRRYRGISLLVVSPALSQFLRTPGNALGSRHQRLSRAIGRGTLSSPMDSRSAARHLKHVEQGGFDQEHFAIAAE